MNVSQDSWQVKSLGEICSITTGNKDVNEGDVNGEYFFFTCAAEPLRSSSYSFEGKAILLPGNGANVGLVLYYDGKFEAYQRTYVLNNFTADVKYVYFHLRERWKISQENKQYGSATNYIRFDNIANYKIPIPPLTIQKQIAEILEKADQAKQKRKEANKLTDEFLQSVFIEMFGDPVKNPKGWEVKRFDKITEILMGQSPMGDTYNEVGNGSPLLNGPAEFGIKYPVVVQWTSNPTKLSKVNDILFCVRGATTGRMNWSDKEYCIGRGLAAIRSRENSKIEVIYFFLKMKYSQFQGLGQGSTFINLSKDLISSLKIPVPPLHLQQQFADIVNKTEVLKEKQKQSEQELQNLFQSLM